MDPRFTIRAISKNDFPNWEPLWKAFFVAHDRTISDEVTETTFRRLIDPNVPMFAFVAVADGSIAGFATHIYHVDTVTIGPVCYLKNLFTIPEMRGRGIGKALIMAVYDAAARDGAERVTWLVKEDNQAAISLYGSLAVRTGFTQFRKLLV
ncbi:MAG: GNAT family N-acetyltransferase [Bosea sp. (in: a-proteobacteria)]